jgi:hypothetical protein
LANVKKIFSSETAWPNGAKLGIDGPWLCPFQNCVHSRWLLFLKVMIISLWNLLLYHSIVRWAIQAIELLNDEKWKFRFECPLKV